MSPLGPAASGDRTRLVLAGLALMSVAALGVALVGERFFAIDPCILCLYQRIPYIIVAAVATAALILRLSPWLRQVAIFVCALVLIAGAALAFYSVGVEERWWAGVPGCEGTIPTIASPQDLQDLLKQPAGGLRACTDNVWRLFGLSLAAYNVVLQLAAAATAVVVPRLAWWNRSDR